MFFTRFAVPLLLAAAASVNGANVELSLVRSPSGKVGQITIQGAPAGTRLAVLDGIHPIGTMVPDSSGAARLTTDSLASGPHTIRVVEWGTGRIAATPLHFMLETPRADSFASSAAYATGIQSAVIAYGDLDGDGLPDLIIAGNGSVILMKNRDGLLGPVVNLAAMLEPTAIAVQDFNGDGRNDLAIAGADGRVTILLNRGNGQFFPASYFVAGARPSSIVSADFNGDGIPDLAIANRDSNDVSILFGNGDGTFQPARATPSGYSPRALVVADFDGDGVADLATANFGTNDVSILLGDGKGGFRSAGAFAAGNGPVSLVVADFDEDGSPDLAVLNQLDGTVSVLLNDGAAALRLVASIPDVDVSGLAAGDMDGDGHVDLVVQSGGSIRVVAGRGDGTFTRSSATAPSVSPLRMALQDFNGDGRLDIAAIDPGGELTLLTGAEKEPVSAGAATGFETRQPFHLAPIHVLPLGSTPSSITLSSSVNPAGFGQPLTLTATVSASGSGTVTFYDGMAILGIRTLTNGQAALTTSLLGCGHRSLKAFYSGDATYGVGTSLAFSQTVNATPANGFQLVGNYAAGTATIFVAVGDFNGDGKNDLAVANRDSNNVSVLLGNGDGTFQAANNFPAGQAPVSIATGDFNGDGITDLAVAGKGGGNVNGGVSILLGNGNGTFQATVNRSAGASPVSVAVGDFNGDGKADLAVANMASNNVSVLLGNGDGTFQAAVNYAAGSQPYSVVVSDFNGDGKADLAVSTNAGAESILLGNGDGTFQPALHLGSGGVGVGPLASAVGDFNGDGISDLAAVYQGSNDVSLLLGNSIGAYQTPVNYPAGTQPSSVAVGDFNGDGRTDLVVANQGSNNVSVLLATASAPLPIVAIDALPPTISGPTTISGWAFGSPLSGVSQIGSVVVKVEGAIVGNATIGSARKDVCLAYSYSTNCAIRGFTYQLNASGLTAGTHTITMSATTTGSAPGTGSATVSVAVLPGGTVPPTVTIDSPSSGSTLSGVVTVSGWTIDNATSTGSSISSVVVKVDGAAIGTANYGSSRPDVCAVYPGRANCPNVGFSYQLNTNSLGAGAHTITVSATDTDSVPDVGSATVTVTTTNVPPMVTIDSPMAGSVQSGTVTVSGWAIDNAVTVGTAISSVQVMVDGTVVGNATYGANRSDVCAVYPGRLGCPNVGFSYALNTSALTAGPHVITVSANDSDGTMDLGTRSVTITVAGALPNVYIDSPTAGAVLAGVATVSGWAIDSTMSVGTPISSIQVRVDGTIVGNATYGTARTDVCGVYPGRPGCPNVGFTYALDTTKLTPGSHMLSVVASDSDNTPDSGSWTVAFQVSPPPTVNIDSLPAGATVSGTVTVSGWAIDNTTAIGSVQVKVDGAAVGNATYGGARPDVCAVYPGRAGCPNVGFTYQLNTASLGPGTHTITAVATDTDGTPDAGSYTLTVTVTPPPPPTVHVDSLSSGAVVSGTVVVSGWAIDNTTAIGSVLVKVDGAVVGIATYGTARPDVCAVYPGRPGCPNVGFSYQLSTASLSIGTHTITVVATDTDGVPDSGSYSLTVTVSPTGNTHSIAVSATGTRSVPRARAVVSSVPPTVTIDSPSSGSTLSGVVTVSGWTIDNATSTGSSISSVVVKVDGAAIGTANYGSSRPDVCAVYPGRANCPNVGFSYQLNTNSLGAGAHTITVSATDTDSVPDVGSATVTVTTTNVPPMVTIDSPMAGSVQSGTVTVSGWAIDNAVTVGTAISSVQVMVDGTVVGNATYGANRSDVCAVYPGRLGCPNVGFSYALNTSALTAGPHVITVSANDSDGTMDLGTRSVTITVAGALPNVYIDSPTAGAVLAGVATVSGWAIDSTMSVGTPISSIQVRVDGTIVGNATYGTARTDVCGVYPGRPGCPNVGFTYALDTTKLTPGSHMLSVVASDSDNTPDSGSWTVAFQVSPPPTVNIDSLPSGATVTGTVTVSGWAIDNTTAIGSVQVKVDGAAVGNATYGGARPDVCAVYPGRAGCPNVGFTYQLNTAPLGPGTHTITAVATDTDGTPDAGSYTLTVTVMPPPQSLMVQVDSLSSGAVVSGTVAVAGWAIDATTAIGSVQVKVDGAVVGSATYGTARPDVCAVYPGRVSCPNVGFTYQLSTASLSTGTHTITVVATDTDGVPDSGSYSLTVTVTPFVNLVAWGDSLTAGVNGTPWATQLSALSGVNVVINAFSGWTSTQVANLFASNPAQRNWLNVIWVGRNNYTDTSTILSDIAGMVAALPGSNFVVMDVINWDLSPAEINTGSDYHYFTDLSTALAAAYPNNYIDIRAALVAAYNPNLPQDVIDHGHDAPPSSLQTAGVHLNTQGYLVVAQQVLNWMQTHGSH